MAITSIVDVQK